MSFQVRGIDHVQVACPPRSELQIRKFYGDILQLEEIQKPENLAKRGGAWFKLGNQELHVGVQENFLPAIKAHPAILFEDLEALKDHLNKNHIEVVEDEPLESAKRFYIHDPFGNRIECIERS